MPPSPGHHRAAPASPAASRGPRHADLCEEAWSSTRDEHEVFTAASTSVHVPDRRSKGEVLQGYYGHGVVGRAGFLSQWEGWYRTAVGASTKRLYQARDLLDAALEQALRRRDASGSTKARAEAAQCVQRVQFYRRTFGLMYLIAEWYRPIHLAVERIRANNPSDALTPMQYPAHVDGTFVTFAKAHPDDPFPTDITRGGVTVEHTGVRSAGESGTVAAASDRILTQVLLRLDGTSQQWTVRGLRNQVHRYLATHDLTIANMPTLGSWLGRLSSEADHRLGICEGSLDEATSPANPTDLGAVVPIIPAVERTTVGVNLPSLFRYVNWWMGCVYTTDEAGRRLLQQPRLREDLVAAGENTGSFGWIFSELKYMCGFVLLYGGTGLLPADIARSKQLILRG